MGWINSWVLHNCQQKIFRTCNTYSLFFQKGCNLIICIAHSITIAYRDPKFSNVRGGERRKNKHNILNLCVCLQMEILFKWENEKERKRKKRKKQTLKVFNQNFVHPQNLISQTPSFSPFSSLSKQQFIQIQYSWTNNIKDVDTQNQLSLKR